MTAARHRHPNRSGLRAVPHPATGAVAGAEQGATLACRCPATVVAGVLWAYDARLGWHDPAEHDAWTPPTAPARAPTPPALLNAGNGTPDHQFLPAGENDVVCAACGQVLALRELADTPPHSPRRTCQP